LLELGLVDEIVPEPLGGAHHDWPGTSQSLKTALQTNLGRLMRASATDRLRLRYKKYRGYGQFLETKTKVLPRENTLANGSASLNGGGAPLSAPPASPPA
jgi:hypothetical protein